MTSKQPIIKFSPFEALLIGEKNKILKRQPMKNTIFVTRLNQIRKTFNLRDLFGLDKEVEKSEKKDVAFKVPQRVCDFLRSRKTKNNNKSVYKKQDLLFYEFEGQKMIFKNGETLKVKNKKSKLKSNKVKFKRKVKIKENEHIINKYNNHTRQRCHTRSRSRNMLPSLVMRDITKRKYNGNRHLLRGKDGKFIRKSDFERLKSREMTTKQKFISNYIHKLYLKKNKNIFSDNILSEKKNFEEFEMPYTIERIVGIPKIQKQFDLTVPETMLNEISRKYYENVCHEDFQFPEFPKNLKPCDFEDDVNLIEIIYENLPKSVKFDSGDISDDFSDALRNADILTPEKGLKIYEKKKNGFCKNDEVRVILNGLIPSIELENIAHAKGSHYPLPNLRNGYASVIDEPFTEESHLISGKSFGRLFFRSAEGKDIFIGNLVKPFLQNSWFGSLPEF